MKVRSEARVSGSGQLISVELEDSDMADIENYDSLPLVRRFKTMSTRADLLVIKYLLEGGHISEEYAAERIKQIHGE